MNPVKASNHEYLVAGRWSKREREIGLKAAERRDADWETETGGEANAGETRRGFLDKTGCEGLITAD